MLGASSGAAAAAEAPPSRGSRRSRDDRRSRASRASRASRGSRDSDASDDAPKVDLTTVPLCLEHFAMGLWNLGTLVPDDHESTTHADRHAEWKLGADDDADGEARFRRPLAIFLYELYASDERWLTALDVRRLADEAHGGDARRRAPDGEELFDAAESLGVLGKREWLELCARFPDALVAPLAELRALCRAAVRGCARRNARTNPDVALFDDGCDPWPRLRRRRNARFGARASWARVAYEARAEPLPPGASDAAEGTAAAESIAKAAAIKAERAKNRGKRGSRAGANRRGSRGSFDSEFDDEYSDESSDEEELHVRALRLMGAKNLKPARSRLSKTLEHRGWTEDERTVPGIAGLVERVDIGKLRRMHKVGARLAGKQATGLRDLVATDEDIQADDEFFYLDDKGNMVVRGLEDL